MDLAKMVAVFALLTGCTMIDKERSDSEGWHIRMTADADGLCEMVIDADTLQRLLDDSNLLDSPQ